MEQIVVGMTDCRITQVPGQVLTTFASGPCIGLAVHDGSADVGGLLHFMLPDSSTDPRRACAIRFMFADTGIPLELQPSRLGQAPVARPAVPLSPEVPKGGTQWPTVF